MPLLPVSSDPALSLFIEKAGLGHGGGWGDVTFMIRGQWRIRRVPQDRWMDVQPRGGETGRDNDDGR